MSAAIALVFRQNCTQVLLVKRKDIPLWVLPGGGIEPSETPEAAACRETEEESGAQVTINYRVALYTPINRLTEPTYLFSCQQTGGVLSAQPDETAEVAYFPVAQLPNALFFVHRGWIEESLKGTCETTLPLNTVTYATLLKFLVAHPWMALRFLLTRFFLSNRAA